MAGQKTNSGQVPRTPNINAVFGSQIQILKKEFHEAKNKLAKVTKQMNMTIDYSFEQLKANGKQLIIEFE